MRKATCPICGKEMKIPSGRKDVVYCSQQCHEQAKKDTKSMVDHADPYRLSRLANAVVMQSCDDYSKLMQKKFKNGLSAEEEQDKRELEEFFTSDSFECFAPGICGSFLVKEIARHSATGMA